MNPAMVKQNLALLLERRNLITLGVGLLILAVLAVGVTLPVFREVERLEKQLPLARQELEQMQELGVLFSVLENRRRELKALLPLIEAEGEMRGPESNSVANPVVVLLQVAYRHQLDLADPELIVAEQASRADTMELRVVLRGELKALQGAAGDILDLPFVLEAKQLGLGRDGENFVLNMVLVITGE